ncbi:amidohydrolase family protein [Pendulispora brunnea]|uniref:Amidohydrolase family protein n=1 Tax=Pendulispora brunnea TaxID=2905690 RepID=A0ABZ2KCL1_9BACT
MGRRVLGAFGVVAMAIGAFCLWPTKPPCVHVTGHRALHFRGGRVFDGDRVLTGSDVLVVDGSIAALGEISCIDEGDAEVEEVDARGHTLLPGLIDAHTHRSASEESLAEAIAFGVTTEMDMAGSRPARLAEMRAQDNPQWADAFGAGVRVTAPGGHGTEFGNRGPTLARAEDADAFVEARVREGSSFIKLIISSELPTLNEEKARAVVDAAHARGRRVVSHVNFRVDAEVAVAAGVDGLAHVFIDRFNGRFRNGKAVGWDRAAVQRLVEEMGRRHIFVVPTLSVLQGTCGLAPGKAVLNDPRLAPRLGERAKHVLAAEAWAVDSDRDCFAHVLESVSMLHGAGVPILAGTDAGNAGVTHGASLHGEMELLVKAGLSPIEALRAATSVPAASFDAIADRGHIAVGARADLLLVAGDPTEDILATRAIARVYKHGVRAH